jgi:hypothetical protein
MTVIDSRIDERPRGVTRRVDHDCAADGRDRLAGALKSGLWGMTFQKLADIQYLFSR